MRCYYLFLLILTATPTFGESLRDRFKERFQKRVNERIEEKMPNTIQDSFQEHFIEHQERKRRYLVYLPKNQKSLYPLMINLHGGMGWAEQQASLSKMNEAADKFGFMVVYPDGTGKLEKRLLTYNAGTCCAYARDNKIDDVGFIKKLIGTLKEKYPIDSSRIYLTGFSNGAMLAYRAAAELSTLIAGIAPVSGDMGVDGPMPSRPVAVIHFHGMKDENALFEGGKGKNQFDSAPHKSIPETLSFWIKANDCNPIPVIETGQEYVIERYRPKSDKGRPVTLVKFPQGGHTWPGGGKMSEKLETGFQVTSFSAASFMWEFLSQFRL